FDATNRPNTLDEAASGRPKGPQRTLHHKIRDGASPSGMTTLSIISFEKALVQAMPPQIPHTDGLLTLEQIPMLAP
ncbi:hypothetical protein, partial [Aquidulcibacter paucihalophilus]|uniref:hypothetical protein n=1 Tax=Aquidulcibacter paucihalophilus TaxID=1978549 RepID=UPI001E29E938